MAEAESEQCRALTGAGERCTRQAQDDGFCHQHDDDDPTIDDEEHDDTTDEASDDEQQDSTGGGMSDTESGDDATDGGTNGDGDVGLIDVRNTVRSNAGQLIGHPFDALIEVGRRRDEDGDPEGWIAVVEVVERKSIPDTQDILGRYEIDLDESGQFEAYRRIQRLHRGDTGESEL
ncbi:gas vesicle protein GvpO, halophile-type [Halomarina salina]|uniref:Gas vesicle protein GvpO, halophile-type n=1 Tax=Halomarina salina TaxID=1872699 RepID=A0ABD5RR53_9EURY|nr:gas vesicle protein GvpO [Halomarina salina]